MSLIVEDISFAYGQRRTLDRISFTVEAGQFCALLGPNGAGKSTLFALLTRLFTPQAGRIRLGGVDLRTNPRAALAQLGVVFQQPTFDADLTVWRNLLYFAGLQGLGRRQAAARAQAALERLNMWERAHEPAGQLNGGHRRRMEIARALLHQPQVLLLDEPTVGLDTATRQEVTRHVHALATEGLTVLWATHLTDEVRPSDQLVLLHRGRVLAHGLAAQLTGDQPLGNWFMDATAGTAMGEMA